MSELIVFSAAFFAALLGSMSGGGAGVISIFALLFLGMPIQNAIATNKLGDFGFFIPSIRNFYKAHRINKKIVIKLIIMSMTGSLIGTILILYLDAEFFKKLIGIMFIFLFFVTLAKWSSEKKMTKRQSHSSWPLAYFGSSVMSGLIGAGTGLLSTLTLIHLRGLTAIQSIANNFAAKSTGAALSLFLLLFTNLIDYRLGLIMFVGNLLGAHIGSSIAIKKGNHFVRVLILIMIIVVAVQLLFFG